MDRSWMRLNRVSAGYRAGVDNFLEFAFSKTIESKIPCPCVKCVNRQYHLRNEVRTHLVIYGIIPYYDVWSHHGEEYIPRSQRNQPEVSTLTATSTPSGSSTRDPGTSSVASTPTQGPAHPGLEVYAKKRKQSSENRAKQVMKHTCGSESIPKKRVEMIRKTGEPVELTDLFVETHTSKKTCTFIDEESRVAAEMMHEVSSQHRDENGSCNISDQELFDQVFGPGTKGRERMIGHTAGRKKGKNTITEDMVQRAVEERLEVVQRANEERIEAIRRENTMNMEALRLESVANMQAAIQAMIDAGKLMVPPTMPRQDTSED